MSNVNKILDRLTKQQRTTLEVLSIGIAERKSIRDSIYHDDIEYLKGYLFCLTQTINISWDESTELYRWCINKYSKTIVFSEVEL